MTIYTNRLSDLINNSFGVDYMEQQLSEAATTISEGVNLCKVKQFVIVSVSYVL